jgi:hypothetical protein
MTTNQTIDGVPRELLELAWEALIDNWSWADELRALLEAPACKVCNDTKKMHEPGQEPGSCAACFDDDEPADPASSLNRAWQAGYDTGYYAKNPAHERPAAQPQGEPVIHINPEVLAMLRGERKMQSGGLTYSQSKPVGNWTVPLYAEQPAPVVVVMPERLQQVLKFLEGAENLDGHWFGEPGPTGQIYWWRNELRKALAETSLFAKQQ